LIRLPAADPARRIGSLFVNPGGPGGSGVDFVRAIGRFLPLELRARFDLVGFDPRGVGRSTPLRCFDTLAEAVGVLPSVVFPVTADDETLWRASDQALAAACAARGGAIQNHMSTANVARDMDLLRSAVGDDQLNYPVRLRL
jgi:pimeloyl-ACP methyl ester carboxylesterase